MTNVTDTQKQLMNFIATALFSKPLELLESVDWDELYQEAMAQTMLPTVFPVAKEWMPEEARPMWKRMSDQILMSNMMVSIDHVELRNLMTSNGIPYVILKGLASSSYYQEPLLRCMGDVDFMVRKEDMERADKLILESGFVPHDGSFIHHVEYHRDAKTVGHASNWEMHHEVNGIPTGPIGEIIRTYFDDFFETAVDYAEGNGTVKIPDAFHHGMVLLLHTAHHMTSEGVSLRHLCDWLVFADRIPEDEFVSIFEERLKAVGLWSFAQQLTLCGIRYLGCPPKSWAGEVDESLLEAMICDIGNSGNFGRKDANREQQVKYIVANEGERTVGNQGMFRRMLIRIDRKTLRECDFVKKMPGLRPLGWVWMCIRFCWDFLRGEKQFERKETLDNAAWRIGVYREFHLFEGE
jgi:hypothetical protein